MKDKSFYAAPADAVHSHPQEDVDPFLKQYGFDPNRERVRWPHVVGASTLGFNAILTLILILFIESKSILWPLMDLVIAISTLVSRKKLYANFVALRGGSLILVAGPILFLAFHWAEAIVSVLFGVALVCLNWGQPHSIRAWIGTVIGACYLALFTLGLFFFLVIPQGF
ncbi:MAG: hypothetical protein H6510_09370 [Acidobacteria bacterium]|nr:hypothetical protein [Acidobacteriota bacterium]MCB9398014.1 hypothetical protein [Acidobacteriota bacterium]